MFSSLFLNNLSYILVNQLNHAIILLVTINFKSKHTHKDINYFIKTIFFYT